MLKVFTLIICFILCTFFTFEIVFYCVGCELLTDAFMQAVALFDTGCLRHLNIRHCPLITVHHALKLALACRALTKIERTEL